MDSETPPIFEAMGLVKVFPGRRGGVRALDGVDVALCKGKSLGIVGESGAGKSTILNILLGIEAPSAGTCASTVRRWPRGAGSRWHDSAARCRSCSRTPRPPWIRACASVPSLPPLRCLKIPGDHPRAYTRSSQKSGLTPPW